MKETEFLSLVRSNQGIIYKLVALYANDAEEKKDLYQEILLNAWKGWPAFREDAKFSTWLYRVCLNTIFTIKRKPQRMVYKESLEPLSESITTSHIFQEDTERLRQAVRLLADTERAIISMYLDGFGNSEIAAILGISSNHVAVKLHRIKEQLSNLLTKEL